MILSFYITMCPVKRILTTQIFPNLTSNITNKIPQHNPQADYSAT